MYKNQIRRIRKEKKLTMQEVADRAGVSVGYICHMENGTRSNPSIEIMERIAIALGKSISEIFFE